MRSTTCDVKLVAYDEPSAALDPKAEFGTNMTMVRSSEV